MRERWHAEGRPPFVPFAPDFGAVAAIYGLRGDEAGFHDWYSLAEQVAGSSQQRSGVRMLAAEVALHLGDVERAAVLIDEPSPGFWWREPVLARRAEVFAIAGRADARDALELFDSRPADDPFSNAIALRARALMEGDASRLREALETFERIECVYEAARTRWMLGGDQREEAAIAFERLGAVIPSG
jgi:hypothetical protein